MNSMISCQLKSAANELWEIYTDSDDLEGPIPFWFDTICTSFNTGLLKMNPICELAQVCRSAGKVLVLVPGLRRVSLDTPAREYLAQI